MKNLILILVLLSLLVACSKKGPSDYVPTDSIGLINKWIADSLQQYYYWSDAIPGVRDYSKSPDEFFRSLLSPQDRFSWISNGADIPPASNSYFTYGFHYAFVAADGYDGLIGVVTVVNEGGPADRAGLHRGSYFTAVNGVKVTTANMDAINKELNSGVLVGITPATLEDSTWVQASAISLAAGFEFENVVRSVRTFSANGVVTGYLYYSSFDENWDGQLMDAILQLKQTGISELVLDLRYNGGGDVASCAKLAGMLAPGLTANETFAIFQGNHNEGRKVRSLQQTLVTSGNPSGTSYADLQPMKLPLNRIFILTTGATVSAAELIVNNLKPFLSVIQIGETTRGKNEAGFEIRDTRSPQQVAWFMEPTVYKLFNKNGEGNYEKGLTPQYMVDELAELPLGEVGTNNDPLLLKALQLIYGLQTPQMGILSGRVFPGLPHERIKAKVFYRSMESSGDLSFIHLKKGTF